MNDTERDKKKNIQFLISGHGFLLPKMTKIKMNGQMSKKKKYSVKMEVQL